MQISLVVDEHEIQLGWQALESVIRSLPDDDESLGDLFHELSQSNIAAVRKAVARKAVISEKTIALLASDSSPEVIETLVMAQCSKLGEPALAKIIQRNWSEVNRRIASSVERFDQSDVTTVAKLLVGSADSSVRSALASNPRAPKPIVRQLLQDPDSEVRRLAQNTLRRITAYERMQSHYDRRKLWFRGLGRDRAAKLRW